MATGFKLADQRDYRRGVVLGLTLAEVLVLLVFLLLLTMAALLARRDRDEAAMVARIERYTAILKPLTDDLHKEGIQIHDTDTLASLIERGKAADALRSQLEEAGRALEAARQDHDRQESELSYLREKVAEQGKFVKTAAEYAAMAAILERVPGPETESLPEKLAGVLRNNNNLLGQNDQMRAELARAKGNGGSGLPYCWALPGGQPQFMLMVEMQDGGVIAHDLAPRARPDDSAWTLLDGLGRESLMPIQQFITQTLPLKGRGDAERCRYAIEVVDHTATSNKPGYKRFMGLLYGTFLIREIYR
jgi:hypothetical protein